MLDEGRISAQNVHRKAFFYEVCIEYATVY